MSNPEEFFLQDLLRGKRQIDSLWTETDKSCSPEFSCLFEQTAVTNSVDTTDKPPAKKPKLSVHSKKCANSPHNLKEKSSVSRNNRAKPQIITSGQEIISASSNVDKPKCSVRRESIEARDVTTVSALPTPKPTVVEVLEKSKHSPTAPTTPSILLQISPIVCLQQQHVTSDTHETADTNNVHPPSERTPSESVPSDKRPPADESRYDELPVLLSECDEESSVCLDGQTTNAPIKKTSSSNPIQSMVPFEAKRPPASTERLGGISRLDSQTPSQKSTKLKSINERPFASVDRLGGVSRLNTCGPSSSRTSKLNDSRNTSALSTHPNERSHSVLAAKEQEEAEKKRQYMDRIQEKDARIVAFNEAKLREREVQRLANEQRRLAVKKMAQNINEMQQLQLENKLQVAKARAKVEMAKQLQSNVTKPLPPPTQQMFSQPRPPLVSRLGQTTSVQIVPLTAQKIGQMSSKTVTPSMTQKHVSVLKQNTVNKAPGMAVPVSTAVAQLKTIKPAVNSNLTVTKPVKPAALGTSVSANRTFDMSQLNSDSESDDEKQPPIKVPNWSRKGNLEQLASFDLMRKNALKWPSIFRSATQLKFEIEKVFEGYKFRHRARTSSRLWNTPGGKRACW